jgi:hypothetical protein
MSWNQTEAFTIIGTLRKSPLIRIFIYFPLIRYMQKVKGAKDCSMLDLVKIGELGDRSRMPRLQNAATKILWERLGGGKNVNRDWWAALELSKAFLDQVYDPKVETPLKQLVVKYLAWGADPKVMEKWLENGPIG